MLTTSDGQIARSLSSLAAEAIQVQDACNLSGVAHAFSRALDHLWAHARDGNHGTDWVNRHPITIAWVDKLAQLAGCQSTSDAAWNAHREVSRLALDHDRSVEECLDEVVRR